MLATVFDSRSLPADERVERFEDFQRHCADSMAITAEPSGFRARARALDLDTVNLVELACSAADFRRTPKLIRQSDPGYYSILLPLSGRLSLSQSERKATLGAADMALYSTSYPCHVRIAPDATLLRANLPRTALPMPHRQLDRLVATPLTSRSGLGPVLVAFLTQLTSDTTAYSTADIARLSSVAIDLLTAVLAHQLGADMPDSARQAALLPQIKAFVRRNLDDPELAPASIAAAHHISVSYLHRLFRDEELTVAAWIRSRRLEHAARDLADAGLRDVSIHRIAARWGFTDHPSFTRAFSAAHGVAPRDYRHRALAPADEPGVLIRA